MTTPAETFDYDCASRERYLRKRQEVPSGHDPANYVTRRLFATAEDGQEVPISLLHRKGQALDGSAPLLLYGYGSYGITIAASFMTNRLSLVDRGFVGEGVATRPRVIDTTLPLVLMGEFRTVPKPGGLSPAPADNRFYARDNAAMARALKVAGPVRPEVVFALTATNPEFPALRPSAPPAAFSNNHFGYALTWFGLAIALVGFYVALLRRRTKKDLS